MRLWFFFLIVTFVAVAAGYAQTESHAVETARVLRESTPFEQMRPTLMLIVMAVSVIISLIALYRTIRREEVKEVEDRISAVEAQMKRAESASEKRDAEQVGEIRGVHDRLSTVETQLEHMPTKESLHALALTVESIKGNVQTLTEGSKGIGAAVGRIENYMMKAER